MKPFPTVIAGIFVVLALGSVIVFATYSAREGETVGPVLVWGSVPERVIRPTLGVLLEQDATLSDVSYQFVRESEFVSNLIAAIAAGKGPDLVIFPAEYLLSEKDKLILIPYTSLSRRDFQNTYVEAGEIFLTSKGTYGLPFVVDPLVMYWNRGMFANAGIGTPPKYWDEVSTITPKLSRADEGGTISQSTVALGTWENVQHAKAILVTLFRQLGNVVVSPTETGHTAVLSDAQNGVSSADSAIRFYTEFSDPVKTVYSWNSSQPDSKSAFIGGKLGIYFGRASELLSIRQANPNLNFDVATLPQIRGGNGGAEAKVLGLSIPRGSRNQPGALAVAFALTTPASQLALQEALGLPTARRDGENALPSDPYFGTFRSATLTAFAFPDPDPDASESIFQRMIENVTSGNRSIGEAVSDAHQELKAIIRVK